MPASVDSRLLAGSLFAALFGILVVYSWFPLDAQFDYVVVGGGTAGITISARLAQHGFRVAVVEAGGYYELKFPICRVPGAATVGAGSSITTATAVDWKFEVHGVPGAAYRDIHYPRGKCMGGSSALNFMMYQRPSRDTMKKWAELVGDPSYLFENTLAFFQKTVSFTPPGLRSGNVSTLYNSSAFLDSGQPLHVSYPLCPMTFSVSSRRAFTEAGINEAQDFNSGSLMGHQFCSMTIRPSDWSRSSSEAAFFQAPQGLGNLTVYQKTLAQMIIFDKDKRAIGVRVRNILDFTLKAAREVIVSAGAFQSPQLLMVSGIGPAETLHEHNITVLADRPGVGQNMWDHIFFGPSYPVSVDTFTKMTQDSWYFLTQVFNYFILKRGILTNPSTDYLAFEKLPRALRTTLSDRNEADLSWFPADWPELEYLAASAYVGNFSNPISDQPKVGQYGSIIGSLVAPTSRGNVTLRSASMNDLPVINPNWLETETDQKLAVAAYKRIREVFHTKAMASVLTGPEYFPGVAVQADKEILDVIKNTMMTIYHTACTCKMGSSSDSMAVVDNKARVFGVTGLRVVDASAFPLLPPGHPQSTVYMLAEKIAADIISR
ncbi:Dehydrogenase patE [Penicillium chermesinum]|uniref:Dehydrogenase patE n=1 Tax=Penicillium chermesinum TaxID=63820 RepID=A0A9W9P0H3_9EURO|nr:Dehydrogenase patE [Penicillium chermesinum]KAJ5233114.1 Dehydrogenase patE [Penicillium chermesinum]